MNRYVIRVEIPEGEVKKILDDLTKAQETIRDCYNRLDALGVITVKKTNGAASGN